MNVLTTETARALNGLLKGLPPSALVAPNGASPAWQKELYEHVALAPREQRYTTFMQLLSARPDSAGIHEDVMLADTPARADVFAPAHTSVSKKEAEMKGGDYLKLLTELGYRFSMCALNDQIEVNGEPINDAKEAEIRMRVRDAGYSRVNIMRDAYQTAAAQNSYHPVRDWFNNSQWDGHNRFDQLAAHFADEHDLFPIAFKRWIVGAVDKAFTGAQNRVLVLDGAQGLGKSHFVQWLKGPFARWHIEGPIDPNNKDHQIQLMTKFIWEVSELGSTTRRADIDALKWFLTQKDVDVRLPYAHNPIHKKAMASFIGTVNNVGGILNDPSGSRRFMVVKLTYIDWGYTAIDVRQVWAQAYKLYLNGESGVPNPQELEIINQVNDSFEVEDPLIDLIHQKYEVGPEYADEFVSTLDLIEVLHIAGWKTSNPRGAAMLVSQACKKMGLEKINREIHGIHQRGYIGLRRRLSPMEKGEK